MLDATYRAYATRQAAAAGLAAGLALWLIVWSHSDARPSIMESPPPAALSGMVRVLDGDTFDLSGLRIRLEGIDAPETTQRCGRGWSRWEGTWACGEAAAATLARLLQGRRVSCDTRGSDAYGRMLAVCFVDGRDIGAEMVGRGLAWAFVRYSTAYVEVEAQARARGAGIWQGRAQPAWEYRVAR